MEFLEICGLVLFFIVTLNVVIGIFAMKKAKLFYEEPLVLRSSEKKLF